MTRPLEIFHTDLVGETKTKGLKSEKYLKGSKEFMDYCNNHGIKRQFSIARTPQQNGVVERKNMIVQEMD
jgi:transposase InsO family protein